MTGAEAQETFLQQSYTTGTSYGVLLDDASADWRRRVRSDSDLGQMLMAALNVTPAADAAEASARYGGVEIRAAEQTRAEQRRVVVVTVAPGWTVRHGPRSGDYQISREPQ